MPRSDRRRRQIAPAQARVGAASAHQLGVGIADADRLHATDDVILAVRGKRHLVGITVGAQMLEPGTLQLPREDPPRQRLGQQHASMSATRLPGVNARPEAQAEQASNSR